MEIDHSLLNLAWYFAVGAGVLLFLVIALWIVRGFMSVGGLALLGGRDRRLGVVEQAALDGRRRLVLVRRDGVEHLLMTGGPIDVVIENEIGGPAERAPGQLDGINVDPLPPPGDGENESIRIAAAQTEHS